MATKNDEVAKNGRQLTSGNLILAAASIIFGSVSGPFVLVKFGINPYRQDPATGTELRLLDARLEQCEYHILNHPDQTNKFDRRITVLETQLETIIHNQTRILLRLDSLKDG